MSAPLRPLLALVAVALLSTPAEALIANDPLFFCEQTGGEWNECGSGCGPLTCETPTRDPETMCPAVCVAQCACPADKPLWQELTGCIAESDCGGGEDPMPPGMALCEADGGTWDWCGSGCGPYTCDNLPPSPDDDPVACPSVCVEQCACPADAPLWDETEGCVTQSDCGTSSPQELLCGETGGAWEECGSGCGPMGCGDDPADFEVCDDVCLEQCACPEAAPLWDDVKGCVAEDTCGQAATDADMDGYTEDDDCDDTNAGIYPGAVEVCNDQDDNCDGTVDEGCGLQAEKNLCTSTGGEWTDCVGGCGPYNCDHEPSDEETCAAVCTEGCQCPEGYPYWDVSDGCFHPDDCLSDVPPPDPGYGADDNDGCAGGGGSAPLWIFVALTLGGLMRRRVLREG